MKNLIKAALTVILVIATVQVMNAQNGIASSKHNLSTLTNTTTQICVFCHTPHSQSATQYLWNRTTSNASYTMYSSPTMDTTATAPGDASKMCLSCHDGTVAYNALINMPGSGKNGTSTIGPDSLMTGWDKIGPNLSNDHPIGMIYNVAYTQENGGLHTPTGGVNGRNATVSDGTNSLPLSGSALATATVECTSCHDPHKTTYGEFLRIANTGSQMCLTCHNK